MSPRAQRARPLHIQIADYFTEQMLSGDLRPGDRLPPIRDVAQEWAVGAQTAQRGYDLLRSARLVTAGPSGTFVAEPRNALGPQQRMAMTRPSAAEQIEMRAAGLVEVPEYVRPVLGLAPVVSHVVRREWVTADANGPYMLTVSWVPPRYTGVVPELLALEPLPDPAGAAHLIAARTGLELGEGESAREARQVLDDGREARLLGLPDDGYVLAETYTWPAADGTVLEYTEFIAREGRVIVTRLEP